MSKSREPESSLELLLDTMCNTFGGVMFIAIALVVILSMLSRIDADLPFKSDYATLSRKLENLKKEIEIISSKNAIREETIKILQNDPRRKLIADIIRMEKEAKEIELKNRIIDAENIILKQDNIKLENEIRSITEKLVKDEVNLTRLQMENERLNKEITKLNEEIQKIVSSHISFKVRTISKKTPYYLIVYKNRIWQVGPESLNNPPHSDVNHVEDNDGLITCTLNNNAAGIPILENGIVSREVEQLLNSIPDGRIPDFSIHSNSLHDFVVLREYLKKKEYPHGINIQFDLYNSFSYYYTKKKVDYEIY